MQKNKISEKRIEKRLCDKVKAAGGKALKFTSPNVAGVPDRIVLLPTGKIYFVELKREDGKLSPIQNYVFKQFEKLGFSVRVLRSLKAVDEFIAEVLSDEV